MTTMTSVTVNITRHETAVFALEGDRCAEDAMLSIEGGELDPVESKIHHENIDLVELKVVST